MINTNKIDKLCTMYFNNNYEITFYKNEYLSGHEVRCNGELKLLSANLKQCLRYIEEQTKEKLMFCALKIH